MVLATSRNLTIIGVCTLILAIGNAGLQFASGGLAAVDLKVLLGGILAGIYGILGKGAASTGGTVDGAGKPV